MMIRPVQAGVQGIVATKDAATFMDAQPVKHAAMGLFARQIVINLLKGG
jgi:hypothetical protein